MGCVVNVMYFDMYLTLEVSGAESTMLVTSLYSKDDHCKFSSWP